MLFLKKGKEDVLDLHPRHTDKNALHVALLTKQTVEFEGRTPKKAIFT